MRGSPIRAAVRNAAGFALIALALAAPARAQEPARTPAPVAYTTSRGGVDLQSGSYVYSNEDLSIGGPHLDGGIALVRSYATSFLTYAASPLAFGDFDHNLNIRLWIERYPTPEYPNPTQWNWRANVQIGTNVRSFVRSGASSTTQFELEGGTSDTRLSWSTGQPYVFTDRDGTIYTFRPPTDGCSDFQCGYVSSVVKKTGERLDFTYAGTPLQLRSVISNRGYAMVFEYGGTPSRPIKICAVNLAQTYYDGTGACPTGARAATYSYGAVSGYSGSNFAYIDPTGGVHAYGPGLFFRPGLATPYMTLLLGSRAAGMDSAYEVERQDFADGDWITYSYEPFAGHATANMTRWRTIVTDPSGTITALFKEANFLKDGQHYYFVSRGPISVTDQLNRTTLYDYGVCTAMPCSIGQLQSATFPDGNKVELTYHGEGNVSELRRVASGTGTADIVETADYDYLSWPTPHANWALHYKPTSITDARGNTTDLAYNETHAGLTSMTGPAVGGIRPQTRHSYAQRHALIKNSAGAYVAMTHPIWVMISTSTCRTLAAPACIGTADEIVTNFDYGPTSGAPNNLLVRGQAVTATDSGVTTTLRTCYGHDSNGWRISETQPRAGLGSCP